MSAHHLADSSVALLDGSVADALYRTARRFPDRNALAWSSGNGIETMTYAQMLAEAEQVAYWLLERGSRGDRVTIWSRNTVEWVLAEYGCALAGMVIAAWNPGWTDYECEHASALTTPTIVLAGEDTRGVSLLSRARAIAGDRVIPLNELRRVSSGAVPCPLPRVEASDLFLIQFTSGTTGRAKGAALSNRAALNSAWLRFHAIGANETDVWLNPSPLNHVGGAVVILLGNLLTGGCYVLMGRFEAGEFLRLARLCGATRIGGVPTMLVSLLEHPDWAPGSLRIRSMGAGGAQVPPSLIERLKKEFGAPVLVTYGQSESPMITNTEPDDDPRLLAETVGKPAAHVELKICDPTTRSTLARGEIGEICVRGPMVMEGYYGMKQATAAAIDHDGFLRTGDLGSLDADGFVRIHGRSRDVIIRGGENIYPAEVEDVILQHPGVGAVAVVGIADERWGQQVGAAVLARAGVETTAEVLEAHAAKRLAHFKVPRRWIFVESFPLTPSGKVRKIEVEKLFNTTVPDNGGARGERGQR